MKADQERMLRRIAQFLGYPLTEEQIQVAMSELSWSLIFHSLHGHLIFSEAG